MPFSVMFSVVLIGAGGLAAGVVGLLSPKGQRIDVALALVMGAGVGIAALAIGLWAQGTNSTGQDQSNVLLYASLAGFVTVIFGLMLLRYRSSRSADRAGAGTTEAPE